MTRLNKYLQEITARCGAATEGPWDHTHVYTEEKWPEADGALLTSLWPIAKHIDLLDGHSVDSNANLDFIAHARTDVEVLLSIIRVLIAQRDHYISYSGEDSKPFSYPFDESNKKLESLIPESESEL